MLAWHIRPAVGAGDAQVRACLKPITPARASPFSSGASHLHPNAVGLARRTSKAVHVPGFIRHSVGLGGIRRQPITDTCRHSLHGCWGPANAPTGWSRIEIAYELRQRMSSRPSPGLSVFASEGRFGSRSFQPAFEPPVVEVFGNGRVN